MPSLLPSSLPWPLVLTVLGVAAYGLAVWASSRHPDGQSLTLLLGVLPFVWMAAAHARSALRPHAGVGRRLWHALPLVALLAALALAWPLLHANVALIYLCQHVGIHAALAWVFARSLRAGRTPLCTDLAAWVHDDMSLPSLRWYTRQVTVAWMYFFIGMTLASVLLYAVAGPRPWMAFSAVLGPVLTGAFFVLENLMRRRYLPPSERKGLAGTWRAVRARLDKLSHTPSENTDDRPPDGRSSHIPPSNKTEGRP